MPTADSMDFQETLSAKETALTEIILPIPATTLEQLKASAQAPPLLN
jgi:hypothetical protein